MSELGGARPDRARLDELLGAALGGDLTRAERAELDALLATDPAARAELDAGADVVERLSRAATSGALGPWTAPGAGADVLAEPPPSLRERIAAATTGAATTGAGTPPGTTTRGTPSPGAASGSGTAQGPGAGSSPGSPAALPRQRRRTSVVLALAASLLVGVGGGFGLARSTADQPPAPVTGPPGTLGAAEQLAFTELPDGVTLTASVVAHTWGTETVLRQLTGLETGTTYSVVLVGDDGTEISAGSFVASEVPVDCSLTGSALREDVAEVSVRTAEGAEVMRSPLPPVETV